MLFSSKYFHFFSDKFVVIIFFCFFFLSFFYFRCICMYIKLCISNFILLNGFSSLFFLLLLQMQSKGSPFIIVRCIYIYGCVCLFVCVWMCLWFVSRVHLLFSHLSYLLLLNVCFCSFLFLHLNYFFSITWLAVNSLFVAVCLFCTLLTFQHVIHFQRISIVFVFFNMFRK